MASLADPVLELLIGGDGISDWWTVPAGVVLAVIIWACDLINAQRGAW